MHICFASIYILKTKAIFYYTLDNFLKEILTYQNLIWLLGRVFFLSLSTQRSNHIKRETGFSEKKQLIILSKIKDNV